MFESGCQEPVEPSGGGALDLIAPKRTLSVLVSAGNSQNPQNKMFLFLNSATLINVNANDSAQEAFRCPGCLASCSGGLRAHH